MALHGKRRLHIQLEQIRAALHRLHEGIYGECTMCGEPIAPERLEFAPEAPTCIECQRRLD
jgi:DnaK suppressor protein